MNSQDNLSVETTTALEDYQRRRDDARIDRVDRAFFNAHPDRMFHIRPSIGVERVPKVEGLPINNACLIQLDRTAARATRIRIPLNLDVMPDDDAFLVRLWIRVSEALLDDREVIISPEEHRQWLIETGHWKEPANG